MNNTQTKKVKAASFSVLALCFCSLMMFLTKQNQPVTIQAKALNRAEIYATRLIEAKFQVQTDAHHKQMRGLASAGYGQEALEGPVGIDPWGKSFNFLVKKNADNKTGVVVLWSAGADNKLETTRDMISEDHINFNGDDFGKAYSFKL